MINLNKLKRNEERAIIFEDENGIVQIVRNNLDLIKENIEEYVIVYNPAESQNKEISEFFLNKLDRKKNKDDKLNITAKEVLTKFIPMLTNLKDFDKLNKEELEEILNDPSELMQVLNDEIGRILMKQYSKTIEALLEMNKTAMKLKEKLDMLEESEKEISEEDKEKFLNELEKLAK